MSVLDEMDYYYEIEARNKYNKEYKENQNPKECSICHKIKPQKDFYKKGGIFTSACKKCIKDRYKNTSKENKQLKSQLQQKENIINELENYIRARADDNNTCSVCSVMTDDLLNILRGSDK